MFGHKQRFVRLEENTQHQVDITSSSRHTFSLVAFIQSHCFPILQPAHFFSHGNGSPQTEIYQPVSSTGQIAMKTDTNIAS